jgi:MoaA/NifB/PqqE/SkfB family radical SAM enzyme
MKLNRTFQQSSYRLALHTLARHRRLRQVAAPLVEKGTHVMFRHTNPRGRPAQVQDDKHAMMMAMLHSTLRSVDRGIVSPHVMDRLSEVYVDNVLLIDRKKLEDSLGFAPPGFLVIAPGKLCNLHCTGCYACSDASSAAKLDFDTFDRILTEKEELWKSYFTVITGGEPFLWKDQGQDLIDMAAKHSSNLFLVYTNGTLIDEKLARRLEQVGNITPAISVEGFERETDERRGKGVHRRVLRAFENLRNVGVPFGISVTGTRYNWDTITSDEFADYYFMEQGVTYGWMFQYMPIGRKHTLDLMVTPEQRRKMLERTWHLIRDRRVFVADFWNSGTVSDGCISAGRPGGYMYIQWDGRTSPCAFIPYSTHNICDIFRKGGNLNDLIQTPLMQKVRDWQDRYGYAQSGDKVGDWLRPCPIRDHYQEMYGAIRQSGAKGIDSEAEAALNEPEYREGLTRYGQEYGRLTQPIWEEQYVGKPTRTGSAQTVA